MTETAIHSTGPVAWATAGWDSTPSQWSKTHLAADGSWATLCGQFFGDKEWTSHEGYGGACQNCLRAENGMLSAPDETPREAPAPTESDTTEPAEQRETLPCGHPAEFDALGACYTCGAETTNDERSN